MTGKKDLFAADKVLIRDVRRKIDAMLYERTAISRKPDAVIRHEIDALRKEDQLTPDLVFKDPYFLDFLGLRDRYLEVVK
ncbi:MAG: YhcG family protein [Desulfosarcina sp.]|nr:YhcG family protein [Desulfosarcina sp.]MBC2743247.1 YhcG family protein [Desulfosarcina sp.]